MKRQMVMDLEGLSPIKVSIDQFYGIEINDFAVTVAKTALWIAESQMMTETEGIVMMDLDFLPLGTEANIVEGNALRMDWNDVIGKEKLSYICSNPPYVGARYMSVRQKGDMGIAFEGWKNVGDLDYVACWYKVAAEYMEGTLVRTAFVSTNSVCQGSAVANLWKPLMQKGVHLDFAYKTFVWGSEASTQAHVHCVIVGFSTAESKKPKKLYDGDRYQVVKHIDAYLADADDVFVEGRGTVLCDVPEIGMGNQPIDNGNYLFEKDEMEEFVKMEPLSKKYFHPWYGSREFINQKPRYCLWLGDCTPAELRKMPECMKRIQAVKDYRLASSRASTKKSPIHQQDFKPRTCRKKTIL